MEEMLKVLFELADRSLSENEFPVSAIIYDESGIISCGYNKRNRTKKTTDHAEIIAIEEANKVLNTWNLQNKCMVVTLEPCDMCKAVIREARLKDVYFIVSRLDYKKPYKRTYFKQLDFNDERIKKYKSDIMTFFANKR